MTQQYKSQFYSLVKATVDNFIECVPNRDYQLMASDLLFLARDLLINHGYCGNCSLPLRRCVCPEDKIVEGQGSKIQYSHEVQGKVVTLELSLEQAWEWASRRNATIQTSTHGQRLSTGVTLFDNRQGVLVWGSGYSLQEAVVMCRQKLLDLLFRRPNKKESLGWEGVENEEEPLGSIISETDIRPASDEVSTGGSGETGENTSS